jgi:hypothetical protein
MVTTVGWRKLHNYKFATFTPDQMKSSDGKRPLGKT